MIEWMKFILMKILGFNYINLLLIHYFTVNIIFLNDHFAQIKMIQPNSSSIEIQKLKYQVLSPVT